MVVVEELLHNPITTIRLKFLPSVRMVDTLRCVTSNARVNLFGDGVRPSNILDEVPRY